MKVAFNPHYNNISFTSKVVRVIKGDVPQDIQDQVDIFEESNCANAKKLGQGLFAEAYLIKGTNCVIKKSKPGKAVQVNGDFSAEANALLNIPKSLQNVQKLVGSVQTEDGNCYLITTFAQGKIPDGDKVKWDRESLASILDSLAKLDSERVYHGDVSRCNCLITDDKKVNLLDFQYCDKFELRDNNDHERNAKVYKVPFFIAPSNAQMFEESNFATYLDSINENEARTLFREYLQEKSKYHAKRAEAFKAQGVRSEIVEYENLMAKYLENPTDEIVNLQARKMQILLTHRYVSSAMDIGKQEDLYNIMSAPVYYMHAMEDGNNLEAYAKELQAKTTDEDYKKFLEYEAKTGAFWRSIMKNELEGRDGESSAFKWILRNAKRTPNDKSDDIRVTFMKTGNLELRMLPDIFHKLSNEGSTFGFGPETFDENTIEIMNSIADLRRTSSFVLPIGSKAYSRIKEFHKLKQGIMKSLKEARNYYSEDRKYESLFYSLNALYQTTCARDMAYQMLDEGILNSGERGRMLDEAKFLNEYTNRLENMNSKMFQVLYEKAAKKKAN